MSLIHLLPVGNLDGRVMEELQRGLSEAFHARCDLLPQRLDPEFALHSERRQYHSTEILRRMEPYASPRTWRLLGVTALDLYMPILTFVFGEAHVAGTCALVSLHRLRQDFYGLPPDPAQLRSRLLKEAVHELGHTLGLTHCRDYGCVMAASHSVEWIDIKGSQFCPDCYAQVAGSLPAKKFLGIF